MYSIKNYRDIHADQRDHIIHDLLKFFCPAYGGQITIKKELEKSIEGTLPQYIFLLEDNQVIGYVFLIAEKKSEIRSFPWLSSHNADKLPKDVAEELLKYSINVCRECGALELANIQLDNLKYIKLI